MVERSAVNRLVVGSNPTSGATSMFRVYVLENAKGQFYIGANRQSILLAIMGHIGAPAMSATIF